MNAVKRLFTNPKEARKAIAALVSGLGLLVAEKVLPGSVGVWLQAAQPLLVAYGVWQIKNADATSPKAP